jgi:3-oxoacyl-[acyl-carrier protein] reductase
MKTTLTSAQPLAGKVAIVTGASRGIGRAIAERLSHDGAAVVINYSQNAAKAEALAAELVAAGGRAVAVRADLGQLDEVRDLFKQTQAHFGRLDILVNNAGVAGGGPIDGLDESQYARIFDLNVRGGLFAAQEAARQFGPDGGRIINLSSVMGNRPSPLRTVYAASKAAVDSITKSLAAELGARRITVNSVAPGLTATDMGLSVPEEFQRQVVGNTALGRLGEPQDIADVVAFVASDAARWISGQTIYADGGLR